MKLVILVALALGSCRGSSGPQGLERELARIAKDMCACPDHACAEKVKARYDALEQKGAERYGDIEKLPADMRARMDKLDAEMRRCMVALEPPI